MLSYKPFSSLQHEGEVTVTRILNSRNKRFVTCHFHDLHPIVTERDTDSVIVIDATRSLVHLFPSPLFSPL